MIPIKSSVVSIASQQGAYITLTGVLADAGLARDIVAMALTKAEQGSAYLYEAPGVRIEIDLRKGTSISILVTEPQFRAGFSQAYESDNKEAGS